MGKIIILDETGTQWVSDIADVNVSNSHIAWFPGKMTCPLPLSAFQQVRTRVTRHDQPLIFVIGRRVVKLY